MQVFSLWAICSGRIEFYDTNISKIDLTYSFPLQEYSQGQMHMTLQILLSQSLRKLRSHFQHCVIIFIIALYFNLGFFFKI